MGIAHERRAPQPDLSPGPTMLYLVKQVELAIRTRLDDLVRPADLTALQYTAMTVLERQSDLTAARLARRSFVTAQSMADMVTALLDRGLVERRRDPADGRRLLLALTATGQRVLDEYRPKVAALEARMLHDLSATEAMELRRVLESCRAALVEWAP
ncbi:MULTISPECIES: MarR family winged helix-turn-helix transcriptional regulator [Pseudofrankia]|uniref:MarR family winged helix-turn-helix transcriptional regulator n=1 Tax=Pseudofrankia TaxID=2994363 RepID=UPI0002E83167|nr:MULTISPECIES: MarR family transcriptional regulator [Pseudofrankia]OHV30062.1 MarR family transcriptional regulator [Pseudofrankia sp. EUN1h]